MGWALRRFGLAAVLTAGCSAAVGAEQSWNVAPAYQTAAAGSNDFAVVDDRGISHTLYSGSYAIIILEGSYRPEGRYVPVTAGAAMSERLLVPVLEERGFRVLLWKDLEAAALRQVLYDVFSTLGYEDEARLFFYYFGHGQVIGMADDPAGQRTYLVPVDAPNPVTDLKGFQRTAFPITQIVEYAKQATVKHAFFALESCYAGVVIASLAGPKPPYPKGYLLNPDILKPVRQFLTAGNDIQEVPANNSFTALVAGALADPDADANHDGYVTGSEAILYVMSRLPQNIYRSTPEHGRYPLISTGDLVFGPVNPREPQYRDTFVPPLNPQEAGLPAMSRAQLLEALDRRLAALKEFDDRQRQQYNEQAKTEWIQDLATSFGTSFNRPGDPGVMARMFDRVQIHLLMTEKRNSEFADRHRPALLALRDELLRRGARLEIAANTQSAEDKKLSAGAVVLASGEVGDVESLTAVAAYLTALAKVLP
jgi:hypothetical protein